MNQVSRPMQISLVAILVFAALWFVVLRPKDAAEDVAATPVTPAATTPPKADAGGEAAGTALGKTIETAKNGAAAADASVKARESQTGEDAGADATTKTPTAEEAATAAARATGATTPTETITSSKSSAKADAKASKSSAAQDKADDAIRSIKRDLKARRAVVAFVWSKAGKEDQIVRKRLRLIDRRDGRVKLYLISVGDVGRYDGLLGGLALGQTPSTIVIAPNNQAKVMGGLVSVERIDRLTSSATQTKPAPTTP